MAEYEIVPMRDIDSFTGHTIIYSELDDKKLARVGELNVLSDSDADGQCVLHVYQDMRPLFRLPSEPDFWGFDHTRTAWKWVKENLGVTWV